MRSYILAKSELGNCLAAVACAHPLWIPAEEDGLVDFCRYDEESIVCLDAKPRSPAKKFVFPQREEMFDLTIAPGDPCIRVTESEKSVHQQVVFGVRPCDASAVQLLSTVFLARPTPASEDIYFQRCVNATVLIGWACNSPDPTCFCTAVGAHPHGQEGLDALMIDLGNEILVKSLTDRAPAIFARYPMAEADAATLSRAGGMAERVGEAMPKGLLLGRPFGEDTEAVHGLSLWEETAERCLNCGICTYLCPTCSCFDILDHVEHHGGCRFRIWDSCMFSLFTRHASGYNPRSTKAGRLRQRFMHKLKYFPERNNGRVSCVGCGRCVEFCPVNIDIREVAERMTGLNG